MNLVLVSGNSDGSVIPKQFSKSINVYNDNVKTSGNNSEGIANGKLLSLLYQTVSLLLRLVSDLNMRIAPQHFNNCTPKPNHKP